MILAKVHVCPRKSENSTGLRQSPRGRYCVDCPVPFRRKPVVSPFGGRLCCINSINCIFCIINHVRMRACVRSPRQVRPSIRPARRMPARGHRFVRAGARAAAEQALRISRPQQRRGSPSRGWAEQGNRPGVAPQNRTVSAGEKMNGARPVALPRLYLEISFYSLPASFL